MQTSDIRISVTSDEDGFRDIAWEADDAPEPGRQRAKAMFLALWDADARNALRIDLWARDLTVDDMNDFLFQTLLTLADTYENATGDKEIMSDIKIFAREFAKKASDKQQRAGR